MSELLVACVDGESRTGKTTASEGLTEALENLGLNVYHDSGGSFYRRLVAKVRSDLKLSEDDPLPQGEELTQAAQRASNDPSVYDSRTDFGDLDRPSIKNSVSVLGETAVAQAAGDRWYRETAKKALESGADIFVVDGRNPRDRLREQAGEHMDLKFLLELIVECNPEVAARRSLGLDRPHSDQDIADEAEKINIRRHKDRHRLINPYLPPTLSKRYTPGFDDAEETIEAIWQPRSDELEPPTPVVLDNSFMTREQLRTAVADLGAASIQRITAKTLN
jgi:cytidylate kinase